MPSFEYESRLLKGGAARIAGLDEAGRGALAGPVVAAAVILPPNLPEALLTRINDSKLLRPSAREAICDALAAAEGVIYAASAVSAADIDNLNILGATRLAMQQAAASLKAPPDHLLVDGREIRALSDLPTNFVIKGDAHSYSIAAASIVAKVTRDRLMAGELSSKYPAYGFKAHKGYGTAQHIRAIKEHGPSAEHRRSFEPLRTMLTQGSLAA